MNSQLYEHLGYVPETSFEDSPVRVSSQKILEAEGGAGAGTPNNSQSEWDFFESSPVLQSSFTNTPPPAAQPRSILKKTPGFMTPGAKKKLGFSKNRKSLSCDVTPRACSPAYFGRNSITREEMADIAFCLEKTLEFLSNSPAVQSVDQIDQEPKAGSSSSGQGNNEKSFAEAAGTISKLEDKPESSFQLSTLMMKMQVSSSPLERTLSRNQISRLGLQSTPLPTSSCNMEMESPTSKYFSPSMVQEQQ